MKTVIYNARVVLDEGLIPNGSVVIEEGKIQSVGPGENGGQAHERMDEQIDKRLAERIDVQDGYVFPGFIDLHLHGGDSCDFRDGSDEAYRRISSYHAKHGTTSLLATVGSHPLEKLPDVLSHAARFIRTANSYRGSEILGIHLEGPFISSKYAGNMKPANIVPPSVDTMRRLLDAADGAIRMVTLAPELPGSAEVIRLLTDQGIVVSAGHSGATYEELERAVEQGVSHITHCYNAMRAFHHREPGIMASTLLDDRLTAEYIGDFIHSHPAAGKLLFRAKGYRGVALITDASQYTGIRSGPLLNAAGNLAGSAISLDSAVCNVITGLGVQPWEAAEMASATPARIIGVAGRKGAIQRGRDADLVIMDRDFQVQATFIRGQRSEVQ
jgi:N-acetylglucosamine-6-phosphate deacetylase